MCNRRSHFLASIVAIICILVATFPASAHPAAEPPIDSGAAGITTGPDGNLWFTESRANNVSRLTPGGVLTRFALPTPRSGPLSIVSGPDGNLWFTERDGGKIGRITPAGHIDEFTLVDGSPQSQYYRPNQITTGPDGNLWFTLLPNQVGRITPSGSITVIPLPLHPNSQPEAIVTGADGALWITNGGAVAIQRITPDGKVSTYPVPDQIGAGFVIVAGPDSALWYPGAGAVARIALDGTVRVVPLPELGLGAVTGMVAGPDGNLWVSIDHRIIRMQIDGQAHVFATGSLPAGPLTFGPDGAIWFTAVDRIGRMAPDGTISSLMIASPRAVDNRYFAQTGYRIEMMRSGATFRIVVAWRRSAIRSRMNFCSWGFRSRSSSVMPYR